MGSSWLLIVTVCVLVAAVCAFMVVKRAKALQKFRRPYSELDFYDEHGKDDELATRSSLSCRLFLRSNPEFEVGGCVLVCGCQLTV